MYDFKNNLVKAFLPKPLKERVQLGLVVSSVHAVLVDCRGSYQCSSQSEQIIVMKVRGLN